MAHCRSANSNRSTSSCPSRNLPTPSCPPSTTFSPHNQSPSFPAGWMAGSAATRPLVDLPYLVSLIPVQSRAVQQHINQAAERRHSLAQRVRGCYETRSLKITKVDVVRFRVCPLALKHCGCE